eukprot:jgi/Ulvmu1/3104/UM015_0144.1
MVGAALQSRYVRPVNLFKPQPVRARRVVVRAKLISKSVIPAFIARNEMMDQLERWMEIEVKNEGISNFGFPCTFENVQQDDDLWGFKVHIERDGETAATLKLVLDNENAVKHAFIGQDERGMPKPMGDQTEVKGAHLEIWKDCDNDVDDTLRTSIKLICQAIGAAMNRYYSFGHVFSEEI